MNYFAEISVRYNPEISREQVRNTLFGKLHIALADLRNGPSKDARFERIGVSFPDVTPSPLRHLELTDGNAATGGRKPTSRLGYRLRLHSEQDDPLEALLKHNRLSVMRDYVDISDIQETPTSLKGHCCVKRVQAKSGVERLRKRRVTRHDIGYAEAIEQIPDDASELLSLPFIQMTSASTKQPRFRLFIDHGPLVDDAVPGTFNTYGLSSEATIPWF